MKTIKYIIPSLCTVCACLFSCATPEVVFDGTQRVYFLKDSIGYSFGAKPLSVTTDTIHFPVRIIGAPVASARKFTVLIDTKRSTATAGKEYKDFGGECALLADSVNAYIPIVVYRQSLTQDSTYQLFFSLMPNNTFELGVQELENPVRVDPVRQANLPP